MIDWLKRLWLCLNVLFRAGWQHDDCGEERDV